MPRHVRMVRGTFEANRLQEATALAQSIDEQLRSDLEEFDELVTMKQVDGSHFIWLAYFHAQCPIGWEAIIDRFRKYQETAKEAAITFDIEEFGVYEVTYPPDTAD